MRIFRRPTQLHANWFRLFRVWGIVCAFGAASVLFSLHVAAAGGETLRREVNLDWEPVDGATLYEIQITRVLKGGERKKPLFFKLKTAAWKGKINPGQYEMQLRSYDDRGVPGDWSEPSAFWVRIAAPEPVAPQKFVKSQDGADTSVAFKWKPVPGADRYRLEIASEDQSFQKTVETTKPEHVETLAVARGYTWRVTAIMPEDEDGERRESPETFSLLGPRLEKPVINKPYTRFVQKLDWSRPEFAESFEYAIQRQGANQKWEIVERKTGFTETEIPFDLAHPSGLYRLSVQAFAKNREKSKVAMVEFPIEGGLRSPADIETAMLKDSLRKPTYFYAIASYFITSVDYAGTNKELSGQAASFSALGGTGRLGLGYQHPESRLGYFGILDLSGFNIGNQTFTFASAEIHATFAQYLGSAQLRWGGGLFLKELPEVIGTSAQGLRDVGKITNIGPHAGFTLWRPLSQKFGVQINGRLYMALTGSSPTGEALTQTLSYQAGILGSYRLRENLMGFAGYAYRLDKASYEAIPFSRKGSGFAVDGDLNTVELQGHYLNVVLEYSF